MSNFTENTFVRGPSPSYSDEVLTDGLPSNEPIDQIPLNNSIFNKKLPNGYDQNMVGIEQYQMNMSKNRNTFAFWIIMTLLFILCIGNLLITLTIIGVLKLGRGMQGMELIPEEETIKFFGSTDLDRILNKCGGQIDSFVDEPMSITAEDSSFNVKLISKGQSHIKMLMDKSGTYFRGINQFEIKDPHSGDIIFTTHRPHYILTSGAENLLTKGISATRISSPIGKPLTFESDDKLSVRGSEGLTLEGKSMLYASENKIVVNSTQGSVYLVGGDGVYLDTSKIQMANSQYGTQIKNTEYKICVCIPSGKLYRIQLTKHTTCAHFSPQHDPCV
ncbi:beta-sarcoglycan [Condylostylus longicornis]|uniref:beta-sarcoglycan n=1 Tax=Condylostylus longicornis TaxID=2530218 RepID=UPI00244DEBC7|nr:beta-sarcoglycan [Condylostylus longicornis]